MLFSRLLCLKIYQSKVIKITLAFKYEFSENAKTVKMTSCTNIFTKKAEVRRPAVTSAGMRGAEKPLRW